MGFNSAFKGLMNGRSQGTKCSLVIRCGITVKQEALQLR